MFIFAVVRGDMDVNQSKIARNIQATSLRPATESKIRQVGAEPGYASPIGISPQPGLLVIVDQMIPACQNLAAGANINGFHLLNTNYPRDYIADMVADITSIQDGSACPDCGSPVILRRGIQLAKMTQLTHAFSQLQDCTYQDVHGDKQPIYLAGYLLDMERLFAGTAEIHQDEHGLSLPARIAPYHVHMVILPGKTIDNTEKAIEICQKLELHQIEVLLDDRHRLAGVKFNDADLIGLPIRLTVSERSLQNGGIEYKCRNSIEKSILTEDALIAQVIKDLQQNS